ncbi:hypothetical protein [Pseudomonas chlororaphis]|uniref:hypothetical protein n=1 Tax=Pseudomonas chlororaphis TaxID=587753 RepID=UPI002368629E|nr:hypothetical protein [Pseudomonas chlororaphis]WDH37415.1 hypothetical protein PUP62_11505 [Pseudomonas chlororaphis]WDH43502.1 hypothetical protein PUP51_11510 [Pseudomonas chlororaphis]
MSINDCCQVSMNQIDDGVPADGFIKTGDRNPIGKDMSFYTCTTCDVRWCRTEQTHEPFKIFWAEVN